MPIELKGSCHCGAVKYSVQSSTPVPYQLCCCSICRKVGGYAGAVNLGADYETLKIEGEENITKYQAVKDRGTKEEEKCTSFRSFCSKCSSMLWLWDPTWPELVHPFASSVDEPELKVPHEMTCLMLGSKPAWVPLPEGKKKLFDVYPTTTIESWHKAHGEFIP
ncbi:Mss4-like protein [Amylostereum chailletii]|nr:Mss4-like protein [Amylostereum chailletii]